MWSEWSTAQIALVISGLSFLLALSSFVWNIWSKYIFPKPRVQVTARVGYLDQHNGYVLYEHHSGTLPGGAKRDLLDVAVLALSATNFGPGEVTLSIAVARKSKLEDRSIWGTGMLNPYKNFPDDVSSDGPASGGLPKRLAVGDEFTAFLPFNTDWFTRERLVKFGFLDTFRRKHYCRASDIRTLRNAATRESKKER